MCFFDAKVGIIFIPQKLSLILPGLNLSVNLYKKRNPPQTRLRYEEDCKLTYYFFPLIAE